MFKNHNKYWNFFFFFYHSQVSSLSPNVRPQSGEVDRRLQVLVLGPVVQLVLEADHLLQLTDLPVRLVTDQGAVKVDGEDDENDPKWHHDAGGGDGRRLAGTDFAVVFLRLALQGQELDPAQEHDLSQEEERADDSGEGPCQLYVAVHALVRGLVDGVEVVDVADGLQVGQDAGADHERKQVHRNQDRGAGTEGYQETWGVLMVRFQLHLHHGHLVAKTKDNMRNVSLLKQLIPRKFETTKMCLFTQKLQTKTDWKKITFFKKCEYI